MKKPVVDYSKFRLSRINEPQFAHAKLLLGWVGYFALYFITENLIPVENCHVMHCALDDKIPFCEGFVLAYVGWYALVFGSLLYYFLYDVQSFRRLSCFIMVTQAVGMAAYILYPSIQNLRPETFPRENVFTWLLGIIYNFDTPTGVCPSLHVAYSVGIASVALKERTSGFWWKPFTVCAAVVVSLSTLFVKQHSAVDVFAALPVCLLAEALVFGKSYWLPRLRGAGPQGEGRG